MKSLYLSGRRIVLALLMAGLVACAADPQPKAPSEVALGEATATAEVYLAQSKNLSGEPRLANLLLAARAYLAAGQDPQAVAVLDSVASELPDTDRLQGEYRLLRARIALNQQQLAEAQDWLQLPRNWFLDPAQWQDFYLLQIRLQRLSGDSLATAAAHLGLEPYLEQEARPANRDALWSELMQLEPEQLQEAQRQAQDSIWLGWLELAWLTKHYAVEPNVLVGQLSRWQQANPNHPAARKLPTELERALTVQPYRPQQVAVLLPLTGRIGLQARAIQDGILANLLRQENAPLVQFYDTNDLDAGEAYQQAIAEGAEFVIGPLLKPNLEKVLAVHDGSVPLLALNGREDNSPVQDDLYFFALSPEDEARQAAKRMMENGIRRPLVLASGSGVGKRMADTFAEQWLELADEEVEIHYFAANNSMRDSVQKALQVDQSLARIDEIKALFGPRTEADFRSRRDLDALYLVANSNEVSLLKPFVDVNLAVFADPLALYASSRAHDLKEAEQGQELDGLRLSDMPWLIGENVLKQDAMALWPERNKGALRLFAMGFDSWSLIDRLAQMRVFTGYRITGLSGGLTVTPDGALERELAWARYRRGALRPE